MRILHLVATPYFSGPAETVMALALAQREAGHEVTVACDLKRTIVPAEEPLRPVLERHGLLDSHGLELSVKSTPLAMARDVMVLRSANVDVLHAHFSHDHLLAWLARRSGVRLVRSIHAPRSLNAMTPPADVWTVPMASLQARRPGAIVLPAPVGPQFVPAADRVALRASLGLGKGPLVGMVSTFQPSRRHEVGVEAFALLKQRVPNAQLVLVGDGERKPIIEALVRERGLTESVRFVGYQSGPAFVSWLQVLDEVWVLGLGNDFSGRAAAQARACGVRVVAVDEGALAEHADAVVAPSASEVAGAALGVRSTVAPASSFPAAVARVLAQCVA